MDYSPPGSSIHGILQAGILEWVAIPFSRGSSLPRDQTQLSCIAGESFTLWATREALFPPYLPDYKVLEIRGIADFAHFLFLEQEYTPLGSSVMENKGSTFENRRLSGKTMQRNQILQDFSEPLIDYCG